MSIRWKFLGIILLFESILFSAFGYTFFEIIYGKYLDSFKTHIMSLARSASSIIDSEKLKKIRMEESIDNTDFKYYFSYMNKIFLSEKYISFFYALDYDLEKNKLYYVIDSETYDVDKIWVESKDICFSVDIDENGKIFLFHNQYSYDNEFEYEYNHKSYTVTNKFLNGVYNIDINNVNIFKIKCDKICKELNSDLTLDRELSWKPHTDIQNKFTDIYMHYQIKNTANIPMGEYVDSDEQIDFLIGLIKKGEDYSSSEILTTPWGHFLNAYAIIRDKENVPVGIVGIEVLGKELEEFRSNFMKILLIIFSISIIITIIITYIFTINIINPILYLQKKLIQIGEGDYEVSVELNRNDELDSFAKTLNSMVFAIKKANEEQKILNERLNTSFLEVSKLSTELQLSNKELELSKERVTKAYFELESSQKQLVRSDKMITLGTMVAGIAHEINTPLGAIRANSENILESLRNLIQKLNPRISKITLEDLQISLSILELARENSALSSRESRALRKKVVSILEKRGYTNLEMLTDYVVEMGLLESLEKNEPLLSEPALDRYLSLAFEIFGIKRKSSVILLSSERVSKIVKSLKSFMHFDQSEEKILSDITEGMETVLLILHNKLKYGIEVTKNYTKNLPNIPCYPDELNQIWTNLIHNSIQAMNNRGKLQIDIERIQELQIPMDIDMRDLDYKGEYLSVSIEDNGTGIPPEIRSKIFQAFFTTKPAGEGSGLGLHIIGKILEKHQGALFLDSEPGKTRFTIFLPVGRSK